MPVIRYMGTLGHSSPVISRPDLPFRIEFCNSEKRYFPGEIVEGRVVFLWNRRWKIVQGILVKLTCKGEIHYGHHRSGVDTVFERTYLTKAYYVFGDGIHEFHVQSGLAAYPFMFTLPNTLPQSFIGSYGSVQYTVESIAKISSDVASTVEPFTVNEYLNMNTSIPREILAGPISTVLDNSSSSLLGIKKNVKVTLKLAKRGFVAGEFIQFGVVVENGSKKELPSVQIEFQQVIKFIAQLVKVDLHVLGRAAGPSVGPMSTSTWEGSLEVPELPVTSATNSVSCINISYKLKIEIQTGPISRNLRFEYPVIVGTIPFEHIPRRVRSLEFRRRVPQQRQNGLDGAGQDRNQPVDCPNYLDLAVAGAAGSATPPPSYEEATSQHFLL